MTAPFDFAAAARQLVGCDEACQHRLCAAARERTERALREAFVAGVERSIDVAIDAQSLVPRRADGLKTLGALRALAEQTRKP